MKDKFWKFAKKPIVVFIALLIVSVMAMSVTSFVKGLTRVQTPVGWTYLQGSHTFAVATDTAYFMFTPNQPSSGDLDTTVARVNCITRGIGTGNIDSVSVAWEVWATSDTLNWWGGLTKSKQANGLWVKQTVGIDSGVTTKSRIFNIGQASPGTNTSAPGHMPYIMVVAIGKAAVSGGVANKVNNSVEVNIFEK